MINMSLAFLCVALIIQFILNYSQIKKNEEFEEKYKELTCNYNFSIDCCFNDINYLKHKITKLKKEINKLKKSK